MDVELPAPEAADLTLRAAAIGMPTAKYLGIQVLAGAYGVNHPEVVEFEARANLGQSGPEIEGDEA